MSHNALINRPADAYLQASATSETIGSSWTKKLFGSPSVNTSGLTASSSVYTATVAGIYLIHFDHYEPSGSGISYLGYTKNSGSIPTEQTGASQSGYISPLLAFVELAVGDTVSISAYNFVCTNGSILTIVRLL